MRNHSHAVTALALVGLAAVLVAGAAAVSAAPHDGDPYEGTHVEFVVADDAVVDYTANDEVLFSEVAVAGESEAGDLAADEIAGLDGSPLDVTNHAEPRIDIASAGGAELYTYDNERAHLVVHAADERTYVDAAVSDIAGTSQEGDLVVVEGGQQTGAFVVVGDGDVTATDDGLVADLEAGDRLVFRSHGTVRDAEDRASERLISQGMTAGEVYVHERDGEIVADTVEYADDVSVEAPQGGDGYLEVAVEGADAAENGIVVVEVAEQLVEEPDRTEVRVSDEPAEEVERYGELIDARGERHAYLVDTPMTSDASAAYLVAMAGSEREVIEFDERDTGLAIPGFGVAVAVVALLSAAAVARRRS